MPYIDNLVTRYENGATNRDVGDIFNSLKTFDPTRLHTYFEDFDYFTAADWTITEVGAGGTVALMDADGGRLLITTDVLDDDSEFANKIGESFLFAVGTPAFFRAVIQVSEATQSDFIIGLQITDTTPLAASDGVFFRSLDGVATIDFIAEAATVEVAAAAITTVVAAQDLELAFYWDGIDRIWFAVDGATLGSITPGASLPAEELTISFGYANGVAGAETMQVDYIYAAMER